MSIRPEAVYVLGKTVVEIWPDHVWTTMPSGENVLAMPEDNDAYRATALRLGYGDDTLALCRDHEVTHSALAVWLGLPCSPTLDRVARGELEATEITQAEEDAVLAIQRFARLAGGRVP